jgi:hypothetical protein
MSKALSAVSTFRSAPFGDGPAEDMKYMRFGKAADRKLHGCP